MFIVLLDSTVNASNHTKYRSLSNQKCEIQPSNYTTINLRLNQTNALEVVILLITFLIKYVSNKTEDVKNVMCLKKITPGILLHG